MMMKTTYGLVAVVALTTAPSFSGLASQQTAREAAVALDRIDVPEPGGLEIERIASGLRAPWSLAFLPNDDILVSEKHGGLRLIKDGRLLPDRLPGTPPDVYASSDSGLLDIVLDPEFAENRRVYLAYAQGTESANRLAIWRARLQDDRLVNGRVIFRTGTDKAGPSHPGGRMLFLPDHTLLLTVGDGFDYRDAAQNPGSHLGKVLRLTRGGVAPPDNPFVGRPGMLPEIWSSGHRNIQGLTRDAATGRIWAIDHGPRGGDELNELHAGANYGWPRVTLGTDYDGTLISERAWAAEYEGPRFYWAPSIAPSGLAIYQGDHAAWKGRFFVGGLASRSIIRLRTGEDTGLFVEEERMFPTLRTRIRDIRSGPDGFLYVLTDAESGELWRLRPQPSDVPIVD